MASNREAQYNFDNPSKSGYRKTTRGGYDQNRGGYRRPRGKPDSLSSITEIPKRSFNVPPPVMINQPKKSLNYSDYIPTAFTDPYKGSKNYTTSSYSKPNSDNSAKPQSDLNPPRSSWAVPPQANSYSAYETDLKDFPSLQNEKETSSAPSKQKQQEAADSTLSKNLQKIDLEGTRQSSDSQVKTNSNLHNLLPEEILKNPLLTPAIINTIQKSLIELSPNEKDIQPILNNFFETYFPKYIEVLKKDTVRKSETEEPTKSTPDSVPSGQYQQKNNRYKSSYVSTNSQDIKPIIPKSHVASTEIKVNESSYIQKSFQSDVQVSVKNPQINSQQVNSNNARLIQANEKPLKITESESGGVTIQQRQPEKVNKAVTNLSSSVKETSNQSNNAKTTPSGSNQPENDSKSLSTVKLPTTVQNSTRSSAKPQYVNNTGYKKPVNSFKFISLDPSGELRVAQRSPSEVNGHGNVEEREFFPSEQSTELVSGIKNSRDRGNDRYRSNNNKTNTPVGVSESSANTVKTETKSPHRIFHREHPSEKEEEKSPKIHYSKVTYENDLNHKKEAKKSSTIRLDDQAPSDNVKKVYAGQKIKQAVTVASPADIAKPSELREVEKSKLNKPYFVVTDRTPESKRIIYTS